MSLRSYLSPVCRLCRLSLEQTNYAFGVCDACQAWFAPRPRCQSCGLPTPIDTAICGDCLQHPPPWQRLYCLSDYVFPVQSWVWQLKYQRQFWLAAPLAKLLATRITQPAPVLISVPLHWRRQLWRGFNQTELLTHHLALALTCQAEPKTFKRHLATRPQRGLSQSQRQQNLAGAFLLQQIPTVEHVAIVDDVVTTGATVKQLTQLLLAAQVKKVDIYCLCRTPTPY